MPPPSSSFSLADSLLHYSTPGVAPPSSRVDPKLKLQPRTPLRMWDYWKFAALVASKATELTSDVLSHHIWGPRRKSWGIEMTIVTSLIRGAERHSSLVDIGTIRMMMSIGGLVPLPSDALVTPVTFRVRRRQLRGILAEYDALESGLRELCGEWVVGKKTWQRLQTEWKAGNHSHGPGEPKRKERVILYIHGGAYYLSSAAAQRIISIPLSKYTDTRVFALDYRLAPETCFPGPLHDVVSGYFRLVEDLHIPPENIIVCGDSAGGGLSLALLMYLRDNSYAMPSGCILMSPWVDLTMSCESWDSNAPYDVVPCPTPENHMNPIALYLGEHTEQYLTHPYASPLFGDLKGLPPLLIQAGDAEVLRDEITLLAHKATLAGVQVRHELYEDAIHVFQAYPFLDASRRSFQSMRDFVCDVLPQYQSRSPQLLCANAEKELEQEIESDRAVIVSGDGAESNLGMDGVKEKFAKKSDDSDSTGSEYDDASWVQSPVWPRKPSSRLFTLDNDADAELEDLEDLADLDIIPELQLSQPPALSAPPTPLPTDPSFTPGLRRIHSAFSNVLPHLDATQPVRPQPRHHRSSHTLRTTANFGMSSVQSPPPSPSIRRSFASASHPDITSLVENWSHSGPANQTTLFTTHHYASHSSHLS